MVQLINFKHEWKVNGEFEKVYLSKIIEKLGWIVNTNTKKIELQAGRINKVEKHFYLLDDSANLSKEKLEKLLLKELDEIFNDDEIVFMKEICEFAYFINHCDTDVKNISHIQNQLNSIKNNIFYNKFNELLVKCHDKTVEVIERHLSNVSNDEKMQKIVNGQKSSNDKNLYFKELFKDLKKVINYDYITDTDWTYYNSLKLRDAVLSQIDIAVCPYCNRNYVDVIEDPQHDYIFQKHC